MNQRMKMCRENVVVYEAFVEGRRGMFPAVGLSKEQQISLMKVHWLSDSSESEFTIKKRKANLQVIQGGRKRESEKEIVLWDCPLCYGTHADVIGSIEDGRKVSHCDGGYKTLFLRKWE